MSQLPEVHLYFDNNINLKLFTCVKASSTFVLAHLSLELIL